MGKSNRFRINLTRKRANDRQSKRSKIILMSGVATIIVCFIVAIGIKVTANNSDKIIIVDNSVDIYEENLSASIGNDDKSIIENDALQDDSANNDISNNEENSNQDGMQNNAQNDEVNMDEVREENLGEEVNIALLGELMMGGEIGKNNSYLYMTAFSSIRSITSEADITFLDMTCNITNVQDISDVTSSKYLVTSGITSAFNALGVDVVSLASDHMIDFSKDIFENTKATLSKSKIYTSGLKDICYIESNGKKIAIISATDVYLGNKSTYSDYGINVYDSFKMNQDIAEAKKNADFVIADIHWGREFIYGVTDNMKKIAHDAIDSGANLVIGDHALGNYPTVEYKGVPIVYSLGYISTDSDYTLSKMSYIYNFNITKENSISSLTMTPIYISDKTNTTLFNIYNKSSCLAYSSDMNRWQNQNGLDSKINDDGSITINF